MSVERSICPDIYHPAIARDGLLTRLRTPGGVLNTVQCQTIAELLATIGLEYIQVTNRANLQLRSLAQDLDRDLLTQLAACGLAGKNTAVDGIRNVMLSPTAGIDAGEIIDVRPLANAWLEYLDLHPELGELSNKFSVGFDGGGSVSIIDRPNDLTLLAISDSPLERLRQREFSLHLGIGERGTAPQSVGVNLTTDECLPMLAAIAQTYRRGIEIIGGDPRRKPRLRDVIHYYGLAEFGELVRREIGGYSHFIFKNQCVDRSSVRVNSDRHLGVQQQRQQGRYYLGVVLLLGRLTGAQIEGLGSIAARYGSGNIRLTHWQNVIIPDVRAIDLQTVWGLVSDLGLVQTATHPSSLLIACAGVTGCQYSATDTQADAIALSKYLSAQFTFDRPLNIHFSGCAKSCAQHNLADITLWGEVETSTGLGKYRLEIGGGRAEVELESSDLLPPERVPIAVSKAIATYYQHKLDPQSSFPGFANRQRADKQLASKPKH
ncbi:precorrin-3B synthase [Chamaesiphon sp. VAR_69_metabat_338]|uniref:precorrin-3B synthase n=1 Tax=Chamaesiphon sp. VAR_69_metabat_338 TaxID=2964704 RepID=UPI00286E9644|nr:precorrin-3B synthase [Chamaesiphon sp. VAR_69_metabat_338]